MAAPIGRRLNKQWGVNAKHALYREDGCWYHHLTRFPGALFDVNGYVVFPTEQSYRNCRYLTLGDHVHLSQPGISSIPGYVRVKSAGA